jgi:hypothetical protein
VVVAFLYRLILCWIDLSEIFLEGVVFGLFRGRGESSEVLRLRGELVRERQVCDFLYSAIVDDVNDGQSDLLFQAMDAYVKHRGDKIVGRQ